MNCKLLIIDDELLIRMSLESGLEDLGYQVRTAENIAAGLAIAESFSPDVLLLDNRLQNDSGNNCAYNYCVVCIWFMRQEQSKIILVWVI